MFSAGRVIIREERGQAGFPAHVAGTFNAHGTINDADVVIRNQGQNQMNPYGIPGSQGPAVNLGRAARAIRSGPVPVVAIDRRADPQANITGHAGGRAVHNAQEDIPGRPLSGQTGPHLNWFRLPNRRGMNDPESQARQGYPARLAGGQAEGVGMQNTTRSSADIDESPAPTRIPHVWNDGLNAAAGLSQYAFMQQNYVVFLPHPFLGRSGFPTRGIRAVSGVRQDVGPTASRIRIPAIFVPSAVG